MKKAFLISGVLLFLVWSIGFFILAVSSVIHALLWLALILLFHSFFMCQSNNAAPEHK